MNGRLYFPANVEEKNGCFLVFYKNKPQIDHKDSLGHLFAGSFTILNRPTIANRGLTKSAHSKLYHHVTEA